jgi:hypothetical protein
VENLTRVESPVNPPVFSSTEYETILKHESGVDEFSYAVERAYLRLHAAFVLGQPIPPGIQTGWWEEQARQWGQLEQYWNRGKL